MMEPRLAEAFRRLQVDFRAHSALELIEQRGYDRTKDLEAELSEQLRQFRQQQRRDP